MFEVFVKKNFLRGDRPLPNRWRLDRWDLDKDVLFQMWTKWCPIDGDAIDEVFVQQSFFRRIWTLSNRWRLNDEILMRMCLFRCEKNDVPSIESNRWNLCEDCFLRVNRLMHCGWRWNRSNLDEDLLLWVWTERCSLDGDAIHEILMRTCFSRCEQNDVLSMKTRSMKSLWVCFLSCRSNATFRTLEWYVCLT